MADPNSLPPLPANHLDHPEQWATGLEPATEKQKGFIAVLEKQHPELIEEEGGIDKKELGKSEASEIIDSLKKGEKPNQDKSNAKEQDSEKQDTVKIGEKRKASSDETNKTPEIKNDEKKEKENLPTKNSQNDKSSSSNNEVVEIDEDGKDLKDSKQTTLDGAFDKNGSAPKNEDKEEERISKKAKVDDSSSTGTDIAVETPTSNTDDKETDTIPTDKVDTTTYNETIPNTPGETVPGSDAHLDHPENWTTGSEPATDKQKGFIKVLEKQKGVVEGEDVEHLGKSEASEKIEELKGM
ncbi:uncharacterized protein I206_101220 [Kwoniella pini CBS 10737]|uniref:Uncharacterized protein n=1 Tax=Kwoniella pini CBS 10737 TaxID=1296096 RepID=A0A1B9IBN8_9TREE|nr:uncharacterized protein I206_00103 [Kwoniella pini CBS 10737]OCF52807.1 hypothetical protein I206_00103 [Kwoniella pini CBS 10737]